MSAPRFAVLACVAVLSCGAQALDLSPAGVFVQAAGAENDAYSLTAGLLWPWSWRRAAGTGEFTGVTEAFVSHWNSRGAAKRQSFTQLGLLPMFRYRFSRAGPAWFLEAGIGASVMDRLYRAGDKRFSTTFNFVDVAGVGRSFGAQGEREISLRISHVSNAGIKKPNPGENFVQLRYAALF